MLKNGEMKFDTYHPLLSLVVHLLSVPSLPWVIGLSVCLSVSVLSVRLSVLGLATSSWSWPFLAVVLDLLY